LINSADAIFTLSAPINKTGRKEITVSKEITIVNKKTKQNEITVGYTNPRDYGYAKVCYNNPPDGVSLSFIPSFPFYRFGIKRNSGLFWIKYLLSTKKADIVHTWDSVVANRIPWVVSYETTLPYFSEDLNPSFYRYSVNLLRSNFCKKILPISYNALDILKSNDFYAEISHKTEVVYPGYKDYFSSQEKNQKTDKEPINILFIGNNFFRKGGTILLDVFDALRKDYNIILTIISTIKSDKWFTKTSTEDEERIKKRISASKNISWFQNIPNETIRKDIFPKVDIFVLPTLQDTFGHVLVEAESAGLPAISTKQRAIPEIVEHNGNGFLIEISTNESQRLRPNKVPNDNSDYHVKPIEENRNVVFAQLKKYLILLLNDKDLRLKFGRRSREIFDEKFGYDVRNRKHLRIYREIVEKK